jgi:serine/threonine-protein kinase haspin
MESLTENLSSLKIEDAPLPRRSPRKPKKIAIIVEDDLSETGSEEGEEQKEEQTEEDTPHTNISEQEPEIQQEKLKEEESATIEDDGESETVEQEEEEEEEEEESQLNTLAWHDLCPPGDVIEKIAEASYAEVYRVTNERGTSIIKVIRLASPIKAQTKAQVRSGLVDEEPHAEDDVQGELQISEWLADIPGFVVYKDRYVVQGKATPGLLETHQMFQKKMKRQDPDRAQFYPSPSRYLDGTRFLVVELGDAGRALEDWQLDSEAQLWDVFLLEAIALARAEDLAMFEV